MTLVKFDKKIRNVKLTGMEIDVIIEALEYQPHNVFKFFEYEKIINKLKRGKK